MNNYQDDFTNMDEFHDNSVGQTCPYSEFTEEASQACLASPYDINQAATDVHPNRAEMFVTFNAHGGTLPPSTPNPRWVWRGGAIGTLPIPIRAGFIFTGWWNGNMEITANTIIWHDMTLMASWRAANSELLTMQQVMQLPNGWHSVPLTDLWTGRTFRISWHRRLDHTDWSPMTSADLATIQSILNPSGAHRDWSLTSSWSWGARPGRILVNGRRIAVGFHLFPHGSIMGAAANPNPPLVSRADTRPPNGWLVGGHMCMYYSNSTSSGESAERVLALNNAARDAFTNF